MDDSDDISITLRRMWGESSEPRRGPKPGLSVGQIVSAAVEVADGEGLGAVSMARVAEALGCSSMALYRHIAGKDELLVMMVDAVAGDLPDFPDTGDDWRAGLAIWTRLQIELVLERPWYLYLPLAVAPPGPNRMRWLDKAFGVLRHVDLTGAEKLSIIGLLAQHVIGEVRVLNESRDAGGDSAGDDLEVTLARLVDPERFPDIFAALAGESADDAGTSEVPDDEEGVSFGVDVLLDGIEAYIARRTGRG